MTPAEALRRWSRALSLSIAISPKTAQRARAAPGRAARSHRRLLGAGEQRGAASPRWPASIASWSSSGRSSAIRRSTTSSFSVGGCTLRTSRPPGAPRRGGAQHAAGRRRRATTATASTASVSACACRPTHGASTRMRSKCDSHPPRRAASRRRPSRESRRPRRPVPQACARGQRAVYRPAVGNELAVTDVQTCRRARAPCRPAPRIGRGGRAARRRAPQHRGAVEV